MPWQLETSRWSLIFGDTDLNNRTDDNEVTTRTIDRTHVHPKWKRDGPTPLPYYDVAIWEVRPVTFGSFVRAVCLPSSPSDDVDSHVGDAAETMGEWSKNGVKV